MRPNQAELARSNQLRSLAAAEKTVAKARAAIPLVLSQTPTTPHATQARERYLAALVVRVDNPTASIAELAAIEGLTKNAYWSELRRALLCANRIRLAKEAS